MNLKLQVQTFLAVLLLVALVMHACTLPVPDEPQAAPASATPGDIPTWTPRPQELTALPTSTRPFDQTQDKPALAIDTATFTPTAPSLAIATPKAVSVTIVGGNLNVRRGPSTDYNYVGVLYDGDTVIATGRDRISRWIKVGLSSQPDVQGWITTETEYTRIAGDISNLPFIQTEPALPAFIRNCTENIMWVLPSEVQLLGVEDAPYNEERFPVGLYQIYDLDAGSVRLEDISLSEGRTVDIIYDGDGEKSKCE